MSIVVVCLEKKQRIILLILRGVVESLSFSLRHFFESGLLGRSSRIITDVLFQIPLSGLIIPRRIAKGLIQEILDQQVSLAFYY